MRGDAIIGPSEDGMKATKAMTRRAPGPRSPFVASEIIFVAEIGTASALQDVTAHRRHVAELAGCGEQQTFSDDGEAPAYLQIRCNIAHSSQCADAQAAIRYCFDAVHTWQTI